MPKSKNTHNEKVGSQVERSDDRIKSTGEVFTPMSLVYEMISEIPKEKLSCDETTYLDNSCGSGNFLFGLLTVLTGEKVLDGHPKYEIDREHVLKNQLFGVDLMEDNIKETCERLGVAYGEFRPDPRVPGVKVCDNPHFVCANALEYDYSFGEPVGLEAFF